MAREQHWRAGAACKDFDTEVFFPVTDEGATLALSVCASCPVRADCLDWAILTRQDDGVWGGMTETQRKRERRRRVAAARRAAEAA